MSVENSDNVGCCIKNEILNVSREFIYVHVQIGPRTNKSTAGIFAGKSRVSKY